MVSGTQMSWREQAACLGSSGDLFFKEIGNNYTPRAYELCESCPVQPECLDYAVGLPEIQWGLWGGLPAREIRKLRKEMEK